MADIIEYMVMLLNWILVGFYIVAFGWLWYSNAKSMYEVWKLRAEEHLTEHWAGKPYYYFKAREEDDSPWRITTIIVEEPDKRWAILRCMFWMSPAKAFGENLVLTLAGEDKWDMRELWPDDPWRREIYWEIIGKQHRYMTNIKGELWDLRSVRWPVIPR